MQAERKADVMNKIKFVIGSTSLLAAVMGGIYIIDCRSFAKTNDEASACYLTGLPIMGIATAGYGGFKAGYNTYNPALRKPEDEQQ
jgi:hypothetical protein